MRLGAGTMLVVLTVAFFAGSLGAEARSLAAPTSSALALPLFGNWTERVPPTNPGNLSEFAFAWVPNGSNGFGLLFGGRGGLSTLSNATWTYQGGRWTELNLSFHPSARRGAMMTYDAAAGGALLFGGSNATAYLNDTWLFQGGHWLHLHPTYVPPGRRVGALAYDFAAGAAILFGGHNGYLTTSAYRFLNDTWAFARGQWTCLTPVHVPPARGEPMMAYDKAAKALVLFGGYQQTGSTYTAFNDTWMFRGGDWHPLSLAGAPPARDGGSLVDDKAAGGLVLAGGEYQALNASAHVEYNDTWVLLGSTPAALHWVKVSLGRSFPGDDALNAVYDPQTGQVLLYGGRTGFGVTTWFNATWTLTLT